MEGRKGFSVEKLTFLALLTALNVVLGNVTQIPFLGKEFTLSFLPVAVAGALTGPLGGATVAALGDFIGAHLFPQGAYFFGFTLTAALVGATHGLWLGRRKPSLGRTIASFLCVCVLNLFLNSAWLSLLYGSRSYWGWVAARSGTYLIEAPLHIALSYLALRYLSRVKLPSSLRPSGERKEKPDAHS